MTLRPLLFPFLVAATAVLAAGASVIGAAQAQATCTPIAYVRVINGLGANVRAAPVDGQVIAGLKYTDGEKVACEYRDGWYRLDSPAGWVSATYNSGRNPLLTVRQVTPAPSQTVTVTQRATNTLQPTPTRIITNTPLAASYIATVNAQFAREICWKERNDPPTSRGTCFLVPLDAVISDTVKQIQP